MNQVDKKFKSIYFLETVFLYLLSCGVIYYTLLLLSRINRFFNKEPNLWGLNPCLTWPYLVAIFLGMAAAPFAWEKMTRNVNLKEIGFIIPLHFVRESIYGAILFILFVAYNYLFLSEKNNFTNFSLHSIMYISIARFLTASGEEMFYRGIIQRRLSILWGKYRGLILASAIFAFIGHPKAPLIDNLILRLPFGLILGCLYLRTQSLLIPIVMHWWVNILFAA